ncbi:uncharacterized protein [Macrobrachium rosenbergii]|uniref:uncharacterized protein n=1 Tax=Macrobrachium rosenbergii TaxID=79674 RepID=UPI0034D66A59
MDASSVACRAILEQIVNGTPQPIAFFSKKFNPAEARYSTFDKELCAVYWAVRHFKFSLEGTPFTIYTDHQPLVHAFTKQGDTWSSRHQRHLAAIAEFTCSIKYLPSRKNPDDDQAADREVRLARNAEGREHLGETVSSVPNQQDRSSHRVRGPCLPVRVVVRPGTPAGDISPHHHCLQPAANSLVERFHRSLKASLMARCTAEDWKYQLLWFLLGLRTAPRANGNPSAVEKINGEPLVVPGELVTEDCHNPSVQRLCDIVGQFPPCTDIHQKVSHLHPPGLSSTTHVFVRDDAVHPPLTKPYKGPFRMPERNNKAFRLALHGKDDWVSISHIKPALLEEETDVTAPHPPPEQSSPQPGHCRRRSRGRPRKHLPTPAASRSHAQHKPLVTSRSHGTLQRPSRYMD